MSLRIHGLVSLNESIKLSLQIVEFAIIMLLTPKRSLSLPQINGDLSIYLLISIFSNIL